MQWRPRRTRAAQFVQHRVEPVVLLQARVALAELGMRVAEPRRHLHLDGQVDGRQRGEVVCLVPGLRWQPEHVTRPERDTPPALLPARPLPERPQLLPQQLHDDDTAHIGMHLECAAARTRDVDVRARRPVRCRALHLGAA
eukprot:7388513-Prymnesium_polylepis.3